MQKTDPHQIGNATPTSIRIAERLEKNIQRWMRRKKGPDKRKATFIIEMLDGTMELLDESLENPSLVTTNKLKKISDDYFKSEAVSEPVITRSELNAAVNAAVSAAVQKTLEDLEAKKRPYTPPVGLPPLPQ